MTCNNNGIDIGYRNSIIFDGSIGGGTGSYIIKEPETDYMFIASNKQNNRIYLESTYQDAPYFRNSTGDYKIIHAGNISSYSSIGINNLGTVDPISGTSRFNTYQLRLHYVYNNGYPVPYGNLLRIGGMGEGELLAQWTDSDALGRLYYRSKRDSGNNWSGWGTLAYTGDSMKAYEISTTSTYNYINGSSSALPRLIWHIPNVNWSNICMGTGGEFYIKNGPESSGSYVNLYVGQAYAQSDRHKKKSISSIEKTSLNMLFNISDKLLKKFTWKDTNKISYGVIAQELEKYIPEAVSDDEFKVKTVNYEIAYAKIIASLVNEIKILKAQMIQLIDNK